MSRPVISWFEIPAVDFERAVGFYESLFGGPFRRESFVPGQFEAIFPYQEPAASGALVHAPHLKPSADGAVIYLVVDDIDGKLARVPALGGSVVQPRMDLPGIGAIAHVLDTEGNRIGLHQPG